jgi:hypothetical protein
MSLAMGIGLAGEFFSVGMDAQLTNCKRSGYVQ